MVMDIMEREQRRMEKRKRRNSHHQDSHGHHAHHRHHMHHKSHTYHDRQKKKRVFISMLLCLVAAAVVGGVIWSDQKKQNSWQVTAGNTHNVGSSYRNIVYKGEKYQYNNRITSILYAGVDSSGKMEEALQYGEKARADSIALVVMDEKNHKMTILSINRDTMTKIRKYTMNGNDKGLYTTHIGYAYSNGDGGKVSCENLCEAVSLLLSDIPVKRYVVTNQDSMPYINNLADKITLTVPNDDLADKYPEMTQGAEITLDDSNIHDFLQYRDTSERFSNEGRMERQKAYVTAYVNKLKSMDEKELENAWDSLDDMKDYIQTSITRNQYLELIKTLRKAEFTQDSFITLQGTDQEGELHDEFYVDEEALMETVIGLFYEKV